jgi:hypothetical protein
MSDVDVDAEPNNVVATTSLQEVGEVERENDVAEVVLSNSTQDVAEVVSSNSTQEVAEVVQSNSTQEVHTQEREGTPHTGSSDEEPYDNVIPCMAYARGPFDSLEIYSTSLSDTKNDYMRLERFDEYPDCEKYFVKDMAVRISVYIVFF